MDGPASGKIVVSGLHDLLINIDPTLKNNINNVEVAEDVLLHLEETDESFHKRDFVKYIHEVIGDKIGPVLDEEIERRSASTGVNSVSRQESLVQAVTQSVVESNEFTALTRQMTANTISAAEELLRKFDHERSASSDDDTESELSKQMRSICSEGESSYGSTFNQGIFFMTQEQFHCIADEMDLRQPIETRREALSRLCQVPPSDVMASESWSQLRISLMDALADNDEWISRTALSFHAKMFAVSNAQIMRETYTCLSEHMFKHFQSLSSAEDDSLSLDISKPVSIRILKRIRLLNEFQCEVPSIWVRYPESFLEVILNSTFSLLTVHLNASGQRTNANRLTVLHYLSVIDAQANWFRRWLHGNYSRAVVLTRLSGDYRSFLIDAVSQCLLFARQFTGISRSSQDQAAKQRKIYTGQQLKYTCFVHSLSVVARLLLYSGGRQLFPLTLDPSTQDAVTIPELLVSWVKLLTFAQIKPRAGNKLQEPAIFVGKAFCVLCSSNAFVEQCVDATVIASLLGPVRSWLDPDPSNKANAATMLHISEIFACLTSSSSGRKLLLYEKIDDDRSAGHVIAEFAQRALSGKLVGESTGRTAPAAPSYPVIGAFVFVCRQMYNTCDGLLLLLQYGLHRRIAVAWKQASDSKHTPHNLPSVERDVLEFDQQSLLTQSSSRNLVTWEETLIDNLLNFAATPKGLLLLQQTGAISECVAYMHSRYTKKLQVSKCEKFGYGVMVTQIASTGAGMAALQQAGFLRAIVHEFWASLECTVDDVYAAAPRSYPLSPVERSVHKSFVGLANVLSSYLAVHEVFKGKPLPNKSSYSFREIPSTPVEILDRLILLNSDEKIHALFNYEQSHSYGLRLLTLLSCNLDTWLLLETQYNIQQLLLDMQKSNRAYEGGIIFDQLSIERNHILVRSHLLGGEGERSLPSRSLTDTESLGTSSNRATSKNKEPFPWPLFYQLPLPKDYAPQITAQFSMKKESSLSRFLTKTKLNDKNRHWLDQLRSAYVKALSSSPSAVRGGIVADILEKAVAAQERMPEERVFKKSSSQGQVKRDPPSPSPIVVAGVKLSVRYGKHLNVIKSNTDAAANNLLGVIQLSAQYLQQQQMYSPSPKMISGPYPCHDWFASTLFLMLSGNKDRTVNLLIKLSEILVSGYLWPARLHASVHLSNEMRTSGIPPLYSCTTHHVELILQAELPLVHSAFRMSGYTPSQITLHWLTQCFWNYLPWLQITHYVTTVVVMGADYQVYFCVSILKHLQQLILMHRQTQNLQVFLKEQPVKGFVTGEWLEYMQHLQHKYRDAVLPSMRNIVQ